MGRAAHANRTRAEYRRCVALYRRATEQNIARERAEAEHRATDPVERAKTHLRRKGFVVFAQAVLRGGSSRMTVVGARVLDDAGVLAFARRKGFEE